MMTAVLVVLAAAYLLLHHLEARVRARGYALQKRAADPRRGLRAISGGRNRQDN